MTILTLKLQFVEDRSMTLPFELDSELHSCEGHAEPCNQVFANNNQKDLGKLLNPQNRGKSKFHKLLPFMYWLINSTFKDE